MLLKRLLNKFTDLKRMEKDSIKATFNKKFADLEKEKHNHSEEEYQNKYQEIKIAEENLLREADLKLDKLYREEESAIRSKLEKRHAAE